MKDHEIATIVNKVRDIAIQFHGAQQLRERIASVLVPALMDHAPGCGDGEDCRACDALSTPSAPAVDAPRYRAWLHLSQHAQWPEGVPDWARDHTGRMNDGTAMKAVIDELASLCTQSVDAGARDEREAFDGWLACQEWNKTPLVRAVALRAWQARAALSASTEAAAEVPLKEITALLDEAMSRAVTNGADSRSMPDEYVAVAHFTCYPEKYGYAAPPASGGQKLTDELIGIAAKYIQTGYLHDFTNEVRALLRASEVQS